MSGDEGRCEYNINEEGYKVEVKVGLGVGDEIERGKRIQRNLK